MKESSLKASTQHLLVEKQDPTVILNGSTKSENWKVDLSYFSRCLNHSFKVWRPLILFRKSGVRILEFIIIYLFLVIGCIFFSYALTLFFHILVTTAFLPFILVYDSIMAFTHDLSFFDFVS